MSGSQYVWVLAQPLAVKSRAPEPKKAVVSGIRRLFSHLVERSRQVLLLSHRICKSPVSAMRESSSKQLRKGRLSGVRKAFTVLKRRMHVSLPMQGMLVSRSFSQSR